MNASPLFLSAGVLLLAATAHSAVLPTGVRAAWNLENAYREETSSRERVCINGLWEWQPAGSASDKAPGTNWGYFKVPGSWPGITDYMQNDSQTVYANPEWKLASLGSVTAAWYQREITVPTNWSAHRISLNCKWLNSYAAVYVDGALAGELRFPGGELDISAHCHPGVRQELRLLVIALPLKGVMQSYTDSASAREVKGEVARRGLCGDVFLVSAPRGPQIRDIQIDTSVRKREFTVSAAIDNLPTNGQFVLHARVIDQNGKEARSFAVPAFGIRDLKDGRIAFSQKWMPERLWDIHTPKYTYNLELSLENSQGASLDVAWGQRFGFRELWIEGRDFYLNGSRIHLSAVPLDNAQVSAASSTYSAALESLERLKSFGINFVYTHNYGCEPGAHLGFEEILRAADDVGMLVSFTQPHFSHYDWQAADADQNNGYARHAEYYVGAAQSHPSVVMYSMSHNATGYNEDMNPDMIDGIHDARDTWAVKNSALALRAEAIVRRLDATRLVYHHASGNLGTMHAINFYPNFVPIQELSDWFEHWATQGVKPVFLCEYGAPFTWDWTLYRGWYKGQREFGSAVVPWEFCIAEWGAQFDGDRAFRISESEKANLRWEAKQYRAGKVWHRWDYPVQVGGRFDERYPIFERYLTANWRAFRTWGVSAISPWEYEHFWQLRPGVDKSRRELKVDWDNLQRPGFSADYIDQRYERMDLAFERQDWVATPAAQALIRKNLPLLAYIAGKSTAFTSQDHNFLAGETVEKQIVVINDSRESVTAECEWLFGSIQPQVGHTNLTVAPGQQERVALRFALPATLLPGKYDLSATVSFSTGETQKDRMTVNVQPPLMQTGIAGKFGVFDPKGETTALLTRFGVHADPVQAGSDLSAYDVLIIGKEALSVGGQGPDISRVRDGLKVVVFEQTPEVLEKRLGFRVESYGLRQVFCRVPDHALVAGLGAEDLRDWRGLATVLPERLTYEMRPRYGTTVQWAGIPVTRLWRCGNRGNVASVLIEKPQRGDFMPILDGGFGLQYSPLMEYCEGRGVVLFCQMDVTGRTEVEPSAERLVGNILRYVSSWKPDPRREAVYIGNQEGRQFLDSMGLAVNAFDNMRLSPGQVIIAAPGSGSALATNAAAISDWLKAGGHLLALGLDGKESSIFLPCKIQTAMKEHISTYYDAFGTGSLMAGVAPADLHNRDPRELPLIVDGARVVGDGILAQADDVTIVFCQMEPWKFQNPAQANLRRTYRRYSFAVSRLLANMGVSATTPVIERFQRPPANDEKRWLNGFYVDQPEEWDDPYRFFRW